MEVANAIVKSVGAYHLVRYEVGVRYCMGMSVIGGSTV